jgi:hypothetical protein
VFFFSLLVSSPHLSLPSLYFFSPPTFPPSIFFIIGGIGKGVSLLTLDSAFYRNRARRRVAKVRSVSEGVYVGENPYSITVLKTV